MVGFLWNRLAERTGGRVYPVKLLSDLNGVYKQVADDLRSQYSIGYYPSNKSRDGQWRKLKGRAQVRLVGGNIRLAEIHWYEPHGIGRKRLKIKRFLD